MFNTIEEALEDLRNGKLIMVTDDENRENEGDLICACRFATPENVNFMAKFAKGLICMPVSKEIAKKFDLSPMVANNTDNHETAFTVSIDHIETSTGISAFDRSLTAMKLVDEKTVCLGDNEINTVWAVITSEPISFSEGTSIEFDILQSESKDFNGSNGADGLSVFFTNDSMKNNKEIGGSLGYKGEFGVEFDLHYNPAYETPDGEDYYGKHISILSDSVWKSYVHSDPLELCDGEWHHVSIDYKDDVLRLVYGNEITLESAVERSFENLYLAFAGATGEGTCYQLVSNITINGEDISFSNMENR